MYRFLIPFLFIFQEGLSQNSNDTFYLKNGPVSNGYILKYRERISGISDPANFIIIYSQTNEMFAMKTGFVKMLFTIKSDEYIGVESGDTLIVYGKIKTLKKKGDQILGGEKIGEINDFSINSYRLLLSVSTGKKISMLNYIELADFLVSRYCRGN